MIWSLKFSTSQQNQLCKSVNMIFNVPRFLRCRGRLPPKKQVLEQMGPALPSKTDELEAIELTRLTCLSVISCWDLHECYHSRLMVWELSDFKVSIP